MDKPPVKVFSTKQEADTYRQANMQGWFRPFIFYTLENNVKQWYIKLAGEKFLRTDGSIQ